MGNNMISCVRVYLLVAFLLGAIYIIPDVMAFVVSPSQIELPLFSADSQYVVDIVSDVQLALAQTNCTLVSVTLSQNQLQLRTPQYAVSGTQSCDIVVVEAERPSVSFVFTVIVRVQSSFSANITISYTQATLQLQNKGTGMGTVWVVTEQSDVVLCSLAPLDECVFEPQGLVRVCADVSCMTQLFVHDFGHANTRGNSLSEINGESGRVTKGLLVFAIALTLVSLIVGILLYFTRRNRTLLKDTR